MVTKAQLLTATRGEIQKLTQPIPQQNNSQATTPQVQQEQPQRQLQDPTFTIGKVSGVTESELAQAQKLIARGKTFAAIGDKKLQRVIKELEKRGFSEFEQIKKTPDIIKEEPRQISEFEELIQGQPKTFTELIEAGGTKAPPRQKTFLQKADVFAEKIVTPEGIREIAGEVAGGVIVAGEKAGRVAEPELRKLGISDKSFLFKTPPVDRSQLEQIGGDILLSQFFAPAFDVGTAQKTTTTTKQKTKTATQTASQKKKLEALKALREKLKNAGTKETEKIINQQIKIIKQGKFGAEGTLQRLKNLELLVKEAKGEIVFVNGRPVELFKGFVKPKLNIGKQLQVDFPNVARLERLPELISSTIAFKGVSNASRQKKETQIKQITDFIKKEKPTGQVLKDLEAKKSNLEKTNLNLLKNSQQSLKEQLKTTVSRQNNLKSQLKTLQKSPVQDVLTKRRQQVLQSQVVNQDQKVKQLSDQLQRVSQKTAQSTAQKTAQLTKQSSALRSQQFLVSPQKLSQQSKLKDPYAPKRSLRKPLKAFGVPFGIGSEESKLIKRKKTGVEGYDVLIKDKGVFRKTSKPFKSILQAQNYGRYVVDNTTSARYKIVPSKKVKKFSNIIVPSYPNKFRSFEKVGKTKKPILGEIEKKKYRIDTIGEKKQLSVAKFLAKRKRAFSLGIKKTQKKKTTKKRIGGRVTLKSS